MLTKRISIVPPFQTFTGHELGINMIEYVIMSLAASFRRTFPWQK